MNNGVLAGADVLDHRPALPQAFRPVEPRLSPRHRSDPVAGAAGVAAHRAAGDLTLAIVVPMGPMLYQGSLPACGRGAGAGALIISVAVHLAMVGLEPAVFGPEGAHHALQRRPDRARHAGGRWSHDLRDCRLAGAIGLYLFFDRSLYSKALRAAINRNGAPDGHLARAGRRLTFLLAAVIGMLSGVLVAPVTTVYYDGGT